MEERAPGTMEEPKPRYLFPKNPEEFRQSLSMVPHAALA